MDYCQVLILDIKLKTHIKNPKATTKITQQKSKANKPIKETKCNHHKIFHPKEVRKGREVHQTEETNRKPRARR